MNVGKDTVLNIHQHFEMSRVSARVMTVQKPQWVRGWCRHLSIITTMVSQSEGKQEARHNSMDPKNALKRAVLNTQKQGDIADAGEGLERKAPRVVARITEKVHISVCKGDIFAG